MVASIYRFEFCWGASSEVVAAAARAPGSPIVSAALVAAAWASDAAAAEGDLGLGGVLLSPMPKTVEVEPSRKRL